jgi:hypothetical protein
MDIPWGVVEVDSDFFLRRTATAACFQMLARHIYAEHGVTWTSPDAPTFEHGGITANIIGSGGNSPKWIKSLQPSATVYSWALNKAIRN